MPTYTLKIDLINTEPLVSRTIKVSSETSLFLLHHIIQTIMGWQNRHLYEFYINHLRFTDSRLVDEDFGDFTDTKETMLEDILTKVSTSAYYLYDFGDGWKHEIKLTEISNKPQNEILPSFVLGQNACPPEDCGGVYRYREIIEILADSTHEEYLSILEWLGPKFNPSTLNRITIVNALENLRLIINEYEQRFR